MKQSRERLEKPAVFLDRDGTMIEEVGYIDHPDKVRILPGTIEALRIFREMDWWVLVVSNQSGVARGLFPEERVTAVNRRLQQLLQQKGVAVDGFYYCPHHPRAKVDVYRKDCDCRKPRPGLLKQAMRDFPVKPSQSIIVGDRYSDVEAGKLLGLFAILVLTGYGVDEFIRFRNDSARTQPDLVVANLREAAIFLRDRFCSRKHRR